MVSQAGAQLEYKADGTFRMFSSKKTFDQGSYTFDAGKTTTVTSSACKDQPTTYEVYVTTQGGKPALPRFQLVGIDLCDTRANVQNPAQFLNPEYKWNMFMPAREHPYIAYLLRLWWTKQNGCGIWCASLEDPRGGERYCFASLELLIEFLRTHTSTLDNEETHPPI